MTITREGSGIEASEFSTTTLQLNTVISDHKLSQRGKTVEIGLAPRKLDFIQALRGIAVLMVVLAHSRMYLPEDPIYLVVFDRLLWGGGGVDLFFVISGFIMVHSTRDSDGSLNYVGSFALKRIAKVWPPYIIFTFVWIFAGREGFAYVSDEPGNLVRSLLFLPIDASNPMYFGSAFTTLQIGWTLNFEIYFYIVFALSLLFGRWRWIALSIPMILMLVIVPMGMGTLTLDPLQPSHLRPAYLAMMANPLIWDFVAGVLIGKVFMSSFTITSVRILWSMLIACVCAYLWCFLMDVGTNNGMGRWGAFAAAVVLCLSLISKTTPICPPRWLVSIGDVSYTMYLSHLFAFFIVVDILIRSGHKYQVKSLATEITVILAALLLAFATSPLVEKYIHDFILFRARRIFTKKGKSRTTQV